MRRVLPHQKFLKTFVVIHALLVGMMSIPGVAIAADPPKPAKKDSFAVFKPKNAVLTTSVEPAEAKPGDTVTFKVTAKLDPGTHIYGYSKTQGPGPIRTSFDFFDPAGLKIEGDWIASKEVEKHKDPNFNDLDFVEYHEDEVTWSIKLKVPTDTEPGRNRFAARRAIMVCTAKSCSIPGNWTLPEAVLTVLPAKGQGNPLAAVPPADRKVESTPKIEPKDGRPPLLAPRQRGINRKLGPRLRPPRARSPRKHSKVCCRFSLRRRSAACLRW